MGRNNDRVLSSVAICNVFHSNTLVTLMLKSRSTASLPIILSIKEIVLAKTSYFVNFNFVSLYNTVLPVFIPYFT